MSKFLNIGPEQAFPRDSVTRIARPYSKEIRVYLNHEFEDIAFSDTHFRDKAYAKAICDLGGLPAKDHTLFLYGPQEEGARRMVHKATAVNHPGAVFEVKKGVNNDWYLTLRQKQYIADLRPDLAIVGINTKFSILDYKFVD